MFVLHSYFAAVALCFVTMLCWGSWANTQKMVGKEWRFELFYWDYAIGVLLVSVLFALTLGSCCELGRSFTDDIAQAETANILSAMLGGVIFNAANILLVASIAIAGMAVAFPVGIGIALVLGVIVNYMANPVGDPLLLFSGVGLVVLAILLCAISYKRLQGATPVTIKGLLLAAISGILMGFFYRFVAAAMSTDFVQLEAGKLGPYSAVVFFSLGLFLSNFVLNTYFMKKPLVGRPVGFEAYFSGSLYNHAVGILGGAIWCIGMSLSIISSGQAGFAISYGLGQGATMVAAFWGVVIWREFRDAPEGTGKLLALMFAFFISGLTAIVYAKVI